VNGRVVLEISGGSEKKKLESELALTVGR